jgi:TfoX/Sxy family transcriptional regulator of competence genes
MKWRPSPPDLLKTFDEVAPPAPVVRRKMFGYPAAFVNGNMFLGLFQEQMILRLPEQSREQLIGEGGVLFEPMPGRPMREYVVVPPQILGNSTGLSGWVAKALAYGRGLPPKAAKEKKKIGETARNPKAARKAAERPRR